MLYFVIDSKPKPPEVHERPDSRWLAIPSRKRCATFSTGSSVLGVAD
jgi:hypothetical protein